MKQFLATNKFKFSIIYLVALCILTLPVASAAADVVTITAAEYKSDKDELKVTAISSDQPSVTLTVVGFGDMIWKNNKYELKVTLTETPPCSVTVTSSGGGSDSADTGADPCVGTTYTISGNAGVAGAIMSGLPGSPVSAGDGFYSATVAYNWSGTVTPVLTGYTFNPLNRTYTNVQSDQLNQNYVATVVTPQYSLNTSSTAGGSVTAPGEAGPYIYDAATVVTLTAEAATGYHFVNWTGDTVGIGNVNSDDTTVAMNDNYTIQANFAQDQYTLTINTSGSGTVDSDPVHASYTYGQTVDLTANAALGWTFSVWSGDLTGSVNPETITMDGNKTVTATFTEDQYTLTINTVGSGTVDSDPVQATYTYGQTVDLTANAALGWTFSAWSDDLTGSVNPETITMDGNKTVTATFTEDQYTLTINTVGSGTVDSDPVQASYTHGQTVDLTANAALGWTFSAWSDGLTGSVNPETITMDGNKTVTASFAIDTFTLDYTVGANGSLTGETAQTVDYGLDGTAVTAAPYVGYHFVEWSDASTDNPRTDPNVTANINVKASFAIDTFTLDYAPGANGSLTGDTAQTVDYGLDGTAVTAVPDVGYHFVVWSDTSTDNPRTDLNVTANINVTASFAIDTFTLDYAAGTNGSLTGDAAQTVDYSLDGTVVTAVPDVGYHFVVWSDTSTDNPRTDLNVTANINVTASFAIDTFTLDYAAGANGSLTGDVAQTVDYGSDGSAVTAVPDAEYHFVGWSDSSTDNPRTDPNVTANINVTAIFEFEQMNLFGYITELFDADDFDLDNQMFTFIPNYFGDSYLVCRSDAEQFAIDPADADTLILGDDDYLAVNLAQDKEVSIYGNTYNSFYLGSNGYITFDTGVSDSVESLPDHFSQKRISALFCDLDPSAGGRISSKQLADRIALTFENVPEFTASNSNNFQIEMFFDGVIRITYLNIDAERGLAGLSEGTGVPVDFIENNLSDFNLCADLDQDDSVGLTDLIIFSQYWLDEFCSESMLCSQADFDRSNRLDFHDFGEFSAVWGNGVVILERTYYSIAGEDGRVWGTDAGGGEGIQTSDNTDYELLLGGTTGYGYASVLSFDTSELAPIYRLNIVSARLEMVRGFKTGTDNPFTWGGNCYIDIDNSHFGSGPELEIADFDSLPDATGIAFFTGDPGDEMTMLSTDFNEDGRANINVNGRTQFRARFENLLHSPGNFLYFYSGKVSDPNYWPKLIIQYTKDKDTYPPEPDPLTWATLPVATGPYSMTMTADTATDDSEVEYYFECTAGGGPDSGWQEGTTYSTGLKLSPATTYTYRVKARDKSSNQNETAYSGPASATTPAGNPLGEATFLSTADQDGRVWGDITGGSGTNPSDPGSGALIIGGFGVEEGYRTVVSFNTASLPDNAEIWSATLELTRGPIKGGDPFEWGGDCNIDIANPYFGGSTTLVASDWDAAPSAFSIASLPEAGEEEGTVTSTEFDAGGMSNINLTGTTQFRIGFSVITNGDVIDDWLRFYSGETTGKEPKLIIIYTTP